MIKGVHHIGYLVEDLDKAVDLFVNALGGSLLRRSFFEPSQVEVALIRLGNVIFELVLPVKEGTSAHRQLKEKGPGFYHIAFAVDDIGTTLTALEASGIGLIDRAGVPGVDWDVAWLQADSMLHVQSQLVQPK